MSIFTSVADLEAAVLQGKTVTPEQFAQAKAAEEAAVRIAQLQEQKRQADEQAALQAEYAERHADLGKQFDAAYRSLNVSAIGEQIRGLVLEYHASAMRQNDAIRDFTAQVTSLRHGCPSAKAVLSPSADGVMPQFVSVGDQSIVEIMDWEGDLHRLVQDAINLSKEKAGQ